MKIGIIDIGSNTVRLNLYKIENEEKIISLLNKKTVAGLASYVENGFMTKKGTDKLIDILKKSILICKYFEIEALKAFATASLRNIKNSDSVLKYVEENTGLNIDLISGENEAIYGYLGLKDDYSLKDGYIVDIGGGSVEITLVENEKILYSTSISEGSLSLFKKYTKKIFPEKSEIKLIQKKFSEKLIENEVKISKKNLPIYGTGGTIRAVGNIASEIYDLPSNKEIYYKNLKSLEKILTKIDVTAFRTVFQVSPERTHTIIPGILILEEIFKYTNAKQMFISDKGVREGYLHYLLKKGVLYGN